MAEKQIDVLVIGSGGREHAIIWKLLQSPRCGQIYFAPGNGIVGSLGDKVTNVPIKATAIDELIRFAKEKDVDLTIVGPEDPLILGIVNVFRREGLKIFGPTKAAARLEGSKAFMKRLCWKNGIPTAPGEIFDNLEAAMANVKERGAANIVIKVDGPALGKGAFLPENEDEAANILRRIFVHREFGDSGNLVIIEDRMFGQEVSMMSICCGDDNLALPPSQDHKRIGDGDTGLNTGGMGAYSPLPWLSQEAIEQIQRTIIDRLIIAMEKEGCPYSGLLYPGIIWTEDGPKLLEVNVRFGDPETQVVLPLVNSDLLEILLACAEGDLSGIKLELSHGFCVGVVMASGGYPGTYNKGFPISGIEQAEKIPGITVFQAGTALGVGELTTNGGRVLCVTALEDTAEKAITEAYRAVGCIHFTGKTFRHDIAHQAKAVSR